MGLYEKGLRRDLGLLVDASKRRLFDDDGVLPWHKQCRASVPGRAPSPSESPMIAHRPFSEESSVTVFKSSQVLSTTSTVRHNKKIYRAFDKLEVPLWSLTWNTV